MDRFSLTRVTHLLLTVLYLQNESCALLKEVCPSAVELVVSIKLNGSFEILPANSSYTVSGGREIQVVCQSRYPVNLTFSGSLPNPLISTDNARISDSKNGSCHELRITLLSSNKATGRYKCLDSSGKGKSVYIFADGSEPPYLLNAGRGRSIDGSITKNRAVLPCLTTNASVSVHLSKNGQNLTSRRGIEYDPTEGFSFQISDLSDPSYYGNYTCFIPEDSGSEKAYSVSVKLSRSKTLDFQRNDTITFEVAGREIRCNGASSMTYIRCNSPLECDFMRRCETRPTNAVCSRKEGQECSNSNYENRLCLFISKMPDDVGGLIFCSNIDRTLTKEYSFFTDFDNNMVTNWTNLTLGSYKFMDFIPVKYNTWNDVDEFWQEQQVEFQCNASRLVFSQGLRWEFQLKDGDVKPATILNETAETGNIAYSITSWIKFDDKNIVKLMCRAPRIDSDKWETLSKQIIVRESSVPQLHQESNQNLRIGNGQVYTTLNCSATGQPLPKLEWTKKGEESDILIPSEYHLIDNTSISYLEVTNTGQRTDYICNATNVRGTKLATFAVIFDEPPGIDDGWIVVLVSLVLILVFTLATLVYFCFKAKPTAFPKKDIKNFFHGEPQIMSDCGYINHPDDEYLIQNMDPYAYRPYPMDKEISNPEKNLRLEEEIGKGNFGVVHKGKLMENGVEIVVAVKSVKPEATDAVFKDFLKELKIMNYVGNHENVIRFIGGVTNKIERREAKIVVEYCSFNNLKKYLGNQKPLFQDQFAPGGYSAVNMVMSTGLVNYTQIALSTTTSDLIKWSHQIACGMEHLESIKIVHRDLAARNVLLDSNRVAKVTDFGLSRDLFNKDYYTLLELEGRQLPWRWHAPEAMNNRPRFSIDSDVWAFGITIWEIFTFGAVPYHNISDFETIPQFLQQGHRIEKPEFANDALYEIMLNCWKYKGSERPRFAELKDSLRGVGEALTSHLSLPQAPSSHPTVLSTSDFSLSDDENFEFDNQVYCNDFEDDSG